MKKIKKALLLVSYPKEEIQHIVDAMDAEEVVVGSIFDGAKIWDHIEGTDVLFTSYPLVGLEKQKIDSLRWIHADMAGLDLIYNSKLANNKNLVVTAGNGRSSNALAEHAIMFMLNLAYSFSTVYDAQRKNKWIAELPSKAITLQGKTIALFGVGNVGTEIAKLCAAFGMNVVGFVRGDEPLRAPYSKFYSGEEGKKEILGIADFVMCTLPLTNETWHTFNKKEFDMMKDSVRIINMSRGPVFNEAELIEELQNNRIGGFAADSFEVEPLDENSPLWQLENVLVSPHQTPKQPGRQKYMTELALDNIEAYKNEKPLRNVYQSFMAYDGPSRYDFKRASKIVQEYRKAEEENHEKNNLK